VYNVQIVKKRYTVARVRERLSDALDEAEKGAEIFIERRGTRFRLTLDRPKPTRSSSRKPRIEVLDPAVAEGQWTWSWTPRGLSFKPRKRR
jgi:antitoxin (DNA-binding transcriptional repressor) of toxin-antitoxin stability system